MNKITQETKSMTLVKNGIAFAVVVVPDNYDNNSALKEAVDELTLWVEKATSAKLEVYKESEVPAEKNQLHIGTTGFARETIDLSELADLGSQGYIIKPVNRSRMIIVGGEYAQGAPSGGTEDIGTLYGVYEFLERYVRIRWLIPGEWGTHVPKLSTLKGPSKIVKVKPRIIYRKLYANTSEDNMEAVDAWRHRLREGGEDIHFSHNLGNILDPNMFMACHPEYYPVDENEPFPVRGPDGKYKDVVRGWHPCYNDDTAAATAKSLINIIKRKPDQKYFSLGINDSAKIACEEDIGEPEKNCFGFLNLSNAYYPWINKVLSIMDETYEPGKNKKFGFFEDSCGVERGSVSF